MRPLEDAAVWRALADRWERFTMVLHHHHATEDADIWPLLLARADVSGDVRARETLDAMAAEHRTIDPQLAACSEDFATMTRSPHAAPEPGSPSGWQRGRGAAPPPRARGVRRPTPGAAAPVPRRVEERRGRREEGLRAAGTRLPHPWAAEGLGEETRNRAHGEAGLLLRVLYRLTRGRFQRAERIAFRYA
jgi:hypothetical protein